VRILKEILNASTISASIGRVTEQVKQGNSKKQAATKDFYQTTCCYNPEYSTVEDAQ
jgi:hypothetical protein